jgi:hypothetical protein
MKHILAIFLMASMLLFGVSMVSGKDLIATWSMKDGPLMTIELQDQDNFRMNMGKDAYILMSRGKGYMVSKEKGEWVATSMQAMKKMMQMSGIQDLLSSMRRKPGHDDRHPPQFKKTGRVETIAGIKGQVYTLSMENAMGKQETVEMVFAQDPKLKRLHQAQVRWAELSGMMSGQGRQSYNGLIKKYAKNGPGGSMLRYADVMKLESVQEVQLANSRFRIPRIKEIDMGPMRERGMQDLNRQGRTPPSVPTDLELALERERLRRQTATKKAEGKEAQTGQDEVMKGMNSLLKGLFGD